MENLGRRSTHQYSHLSSLRISVHIDQIKIVD